ncbi:TolC family protein [Sulfurospirillum arcachonense]|uniref:TolC family protein n=1 Tax=Sulfurospirillum arcachonense TaxID=57666 RepID=UPI0004685C19|nr:TolC family protein [Sulfurospirillum arcachonense]
MRLKYLVSLSLLVSFLSAADNSSLLSALKQKKLDIDKQTVELESDNLKYDWVNQIVGSYNKTKMDGKRGIVADETDGFSISIDQPVFKSGGIYYAVQYSGANREFSRLSTKLNEQNLIKSIISSWLMIKKYDLQLKKQEYLIANAKIDVVRKKEQYESGFLDSSFLDNAILTKSSLEKTLIDLEEQRYSQLMNYKSLSDTSYLDITPPTFSMVDKKKYIEKSLALNTQRAASKQAEYLKKMTIANYLPTVSIFGGYYDMGDNINDNDRYNQVGIKVSMPLFDINRGRTIELKELNYLKSKLELKDVEKEEGNLYQDSIKKIELIKKKIVIAKNDAKLYDSLLTSTKELFEAGETTIYDVDTLDNSKQNTILDKKIYEIEIQQALLDLYAKMSGEI